MANRSGLERYEHKWAGYRVVLTSHEVRAMLQHKADAVRRAAEAQLPAGSDVYLLADTTVGSNRAGATVIGVPMRLEKSSRILGSSIDAAG